tara:strand:+ start:1419 stop:2471 length:1053 start_codon:yes stop_codon:yes gene_type:complete
MQLVHQDQKKGIVKLKITNLDDLWHLSQIITEKDLVKTKTHRKIKLGSENDRNSKIIKKPVTLEIEVEKVEFHKTLDSLRISGKTTTNIEEIPKGSYHSLNLEINSILTITKTWLSYQKEKLKDSLKESSKILILALDREHATLALLKNYGPEIITELKGDVQKKAFETKETKNFHQELTKLLEEKNKALNPQHLIIASPAFFKDELLKKLSNELKKKTVVATCYSTGKQGIQEILKRDELKAILKEDRIAKETSLVESLLKEISNEGKATYGLKEVEQASNQGAVESLLVSDSLIHKTRENNTFDQLDSIMKIVDQQKGRIHLISSEHEAGKKLDGLTGIAAILRFKIK